MLQNTSDLSVIIIYLILSLFLNWRPEIGSIWCNFLIEKVHIISRIYLLSALKDKYVGVLRRKSLSSKTRQQFVMFDTTIRDIITVSQFIKHFRYNIERGLVLSYQFLQIGCDSLISWYNCKVPDTIFMCFITLNNSS